MSSRSDSRLLPRRAVLPTAAALFAAIFVGRWLHDNPSTGISFLYLIPAVLVGVEYGRRAGTLAALVGFALFEIWALIAVPEFSLFPHAIRFCVLVGTGAFCGDIADRLRRAVEANAETERFFSLSRDLLCTADMEGRLTRLNGRWEETLGWRPDELRSRPFIDFVHPDDLETTIRESTALTEGGGSVSFVNRYRTKDGAWRWIEWMSTADPDAGVVYAAARDVTDRRLAEQALREAEERFRRGFEDASVGMAVVGVRGRHQNELLEANPALAELLGYPREDLVGRLTLADFAHPDDAEALRAGMRRLMTGELPVFRAETRVTRRDGSECWVDLTTSLVRDEEGEPLYRLSQLQDIDARKRTEQELRHLANHDVLSGLFNRRRFEMDLEDELGHAAARGSRGALVAFDLDKFKQVNDTAGHAAGDAVIASVGKALNHRLRSTDLAARMGGDEFAVLLRRVDPEEARRVAESIGEAVRAELDSLSAESARSVTLSMGVAPFSAGTRCQAEDLQRIADDALYAAKGRGGDAVVVAASGAEDASEATVTK